MAIRFGSQRTQARPRCRLWSRITLGTIGDAICAAREMVKRMAPKIGGLPITLRLLNSQMESKREIKVCIPTMNELLALTTKVSTQVADGSPQATFYDYGNMPNCWKVIVGEPDSVGQSELVRGGLEWEYNCSDGKVVFEVTDISGVYPSNAYTILSVKRYPSTP